MSNVNVILKNGTTIEIEGASEANWVRTKLAPGDASDVLLLVVKRSESNAMKTSGTFLADNIAGYTVNLR